MPIQFEIYTYMYVKQWFRECVRDIHIEWTTISIQQNVQPFQFQEAVMNYAYPTKFKRVFLSLVKIVDDSFCMEFSMIVDVGKSVLITQIIRDVKQKQIKSVSNSNFWILFLLLLVVMVMVCVFDTKRFSILIGIT